MLTLPPSVRIFAAVQPVDARKSFDGLSAAVREGLGGDPMTGHLFVFINRRGDVAQILFWDRTGFVVMRKRLEAGTWPLTKSSPGLLARRGPGAWQGFVLRFRAGSGHACGWDGGVSDVGQGCSCTR